MPAPEALLCGAALPEARHACTKHHTKWQTVTSAVCRRGTPWAAKLGQASVQALGAGTQLREPR